MPPQVLADWPDWMQLRSENMWHLLRHVGAAVLIVILSVTIYNVLSRGLHLVERKRQLPAALAMVGRKLLRGIAVLIAVVLILQSFGILENAWAALTALFGLIAVGFIAVWSVLSNTLCSIILVLARPFDIGDTIEIPADNLRGKAVNFTFLFTVLRTEDGGLLHVPNNHFFQKAVKRMVGVTSVSLDQQLLKESNTE